ncbi:hypothetical protein J5690_03240 [bacterium]|nr:hypothetical protein [bacterium]
MMQCSDDTMMQQCINSAASKCYYETHSKKYDFDCYDAQSKNDAMQKGMAECAG